MTLYRLQCILGVLASIALTGQAIGEEVASLLEQDSRLIRHEVHEKQQLEDGEESEDHEEDLEDETEEDEADEDEDDDSGKREAPTEEELMDLHKKIDANGDGKASMAEVETYAKEMRRFAAEKDAEVLMQDLDTNRDGKLSVEEFLEDFRQDASRAERESDSLDMEVRKFKAADEDGDGFLSPEEIFSLSEPNAKRSTRDVEIADIIRRRDKDGDSHVSLLEYVDGERHERQARADNGDEEEAAELLEEESDEDHHAETEAELKKEFEQLDADKNGKLSFQELQGMHEIEDLRIKDDAKELFDEVDQDKDEHISAQEMLAAQHTIIDSPLLQEWADVGAFFQEDEEDEADEEDDDIEDERDEEKDD